MLFIQIIFSVSLIPPSLLFHVEFSERNSGNIIFFISYCIFEGENEKWKKEQQYGKKKRFLSSMSDCRPKHTHSNTSVFLCGCVCVLFSKSNAFPPNQRRPSPQPDMT